MVDFFSEESVSVKDEDAGRKLARIEGVFGGVTSGSNVWAALQRAKIIGKKLEK